MRLQVVGIVVVASYDPSTGNHVPSAVHNRQNVTGLALLATLIGNAFASFLGEGMGAVQIQHGQV